MLQVHILCRDLWRYLLLLICDPLYEISMLLLLLHIAVVYKAVAAFAAAVVFIDAVAAATNTAASICSFVYGFSYSMYAV